MSRVAVRLAGEGDLSGVLSLERRTDGAPHWAEGEYRTALVRGNGVQRCLMVAEVEGRLVGFAVGKVAGDVGELESVVAAGEARRRGVGRALCEAVMKWCGAQGSTKMELEVRAGGVAAIALYEALGFRVVGRRRGYYREPVEDAVLMEMELAG